MKNNFNFYMPTRVIFGCGKLKELSLQKMPGCKALIVMSNGTSAKKSKAFDICVEQLGKARISFALFDKVEPNPTDRTVMLGAAYAKDNKCDFIIALGGGSVMDASKAIAAMATNVGDVWNYIKGGTGKGLPLSENPMPIICITTTAGTGSEVDQWGVITNDKTHEKVGFGGDDRLFPYFSIVDPNLMASVPSEYTAYQGFDALFHATECYISSFSNMMSDMYALTAIKNVGKYLARAVKDGKDMEAREHMAFANTLSGIVMTISVTTAKHSLEHAMSAFYPSLPHGAGLIMISYAFYQYFIDKHACDDKFINMAIALGKEDANKPEDFLIALTDLQKACGVNQLKMSDYGIQLKEFDKFAKNARDTMGDLFAANPCDLDHLSCVKIYEQSFR